MFLFATYLEVRAAIMSTSLLGIMSFERTEFSFIHGKMMLGPVPTALFGLTALAMLRWCVMLSNPNSNLSDRRTHKLLSFNQGRRIVKNVGGEKSIYWALSFPYDWNRVNLSDKNWWGSVLQESPHPYNFRRPCQQRKGKLYVPYIGCLYGRFMVQSWPGNAYLFPQKEKKKIGLRIASLCGPTPPCSMRPKHF